MLISFLRTWIRSLLPEFFSLCLSRDARGEQGGEKWVGTSGMGSLGSRWHPYVSVYEFNWACEYEGGRLISIAHRLVFGNLVTSSYEGGRDDPTLGDIDILSIS